MKRTIIYSMFLLLALCSCGKEQDSPKTISGAEGTGVREFTAVINATKVSMNAGKLAWEMDDRVMISDGNVSSIFKVSEINAGTATFSLVDGQAELSSGALKYTAVYPASAFDGLQEISIQTPGEETSCLPMGAVSSNAKLVFTNLCSLIRFSITTNTDNSALKSVAITADKPLRGAFNIVEGGAEMTGSAPVAAMTSCSTESGFALGPEPLVLYAVVPPGEYSRFDIEATTSTGVKKVFPMSGETVTLQRSTIYDKELFLADLDVNDFREAGPANCYIASHAGKYRFATVHNDGSEIPGISNVKILWTYDNTKAGPEEGTIISSLSYSDGVVDFQTDGVDGSALVAAVDASDNILWSWHLWCTTDVPSDIEYPGGGVVMDRYLGALSATPGDIKCVGFMYQYGRKDPFPGRVENSNVIGTFRGTAYSEQPGPVDMETAISHPNVRYYGTSSNFWTTDEARSQATWDGLYKTIQDPCPYGYRVPDDTVLGSSVKADIQKLFAWDSSHVGFNFRNGLAWYPATGQLAPKAVNLNSGTAISFSWSRSFNANGNPLLLDLRNSAINGWGGGAAAAGFAVRCVKSAN